MFFYLAQFLTFLAMPLTWVMLSLLVGLIWRKYKKARIIGAFGLILLFFFTNKFLSNAAMYLWEPSFVPITQLPTYEVGIVLTGVTNMDKTAYDRTFFDKGADRATQAVQLYKMNKIKKILITGGQGLNPTNDNTEAQLLADFMEIVGVAKSDIIIENQAVNTRQNALFAKEKLIQEGFDPESTFLLITSAFHMKRAKACFDKVGISTDTFPVDYYASDIKVDFKSLGIPTPDGLVLWHKLFKEWIGITVYKLVGYS
ncbi:YdcF family protein [Echinicola strongylocentroti]|uniref:YdcF family protein n=1 Tax=Echinicola strongylocentroti TaxID=1795355 RepID=A0A2Z4IFY8_9BACT|nr:YdcF family protein [Echinicola strongylocentroti]AWW29363.1 YdcF family protein [Echinicola strongylocentroti]